jgi:hypothetical protein
LSALGILLSARIAIRNFAGLVMVVKRRDMKKKTYGFQMQIYKTKKVGHVSAVQKRRQITFLIHSQNGFGVE